MNKDAGGKPWGGRRLKGGHGHGTNKIDATRSPQKSGSKGVWQSIDRQSDLVFKTSNSTPSPETVWQKPPTNLKGKKTNYSQAQEGPPGSVPNWPGGSIHKGV